MNERIEKLFDQALAEFQAENKYATVVVPDSLQRNFVEKFAELIVQECCEVLTENVEVALDASGSPVYPEGLICKHFGVEND